MTAKKQVSLYAHIPFCVSKCPYCSFSVTVGQGAREQEYIKVLVRELSTESSRCLSTVYIGGGTPSCLSRQCIEEMLGSIGSNFNIVDGAEVSFEMNPESVDLGKARLLKELGVNRISLGVQSLNDKTLSFLGRPHRTQDARRAFDLLRSAGFANINVDFIYGLPGQTSADVMLDLRQLLALGSEHLSLYALNIEERSLFFARKVAVDNDMQGELFSAICLNMAAAGLDQYEVSNFSRPGLESRHNINYWSGGEYIGAGMAAHSHIAGERFWNADTLPKYLGLMLESNSACTGREKLSSSDKLAEEFLIALRMNRGADLGAIEKKFGQEMQFEKKEALESFIEMGLLEESDRFIRATPRGRLLLDEIAARIV